MQSIPKGANKLNLDLYRAKRVKKLYERSEFILVFDVAFLIFDSHLAFTKNCPFELSESEVQ
jgi:hypothetical protein